MSTLLVIGNGFDLKLGAKTSYKDFFESDFYHDTKEQMYHWIKMYKTTNKASKNFAPDMLKYDFSCWDLLFCLTYVEGIYKTELGEIRWCDIEDVIHTSLTYGICEKCNDNDLSFDFSWQNISKFLGTGSVSGAPSSYHEQLMLCFIENHYGKNIEFFPRLLQELMSFETRFGEYINEAIGKLNYQKIANKLVNQLCKPRKDVYVDSFNYSGFIYSTPQERVFTDNKTVTHQVRRYIRHINGDLLNPIFGIDLKNEEEEEYPECIRFTKTSRRLQQDSHQLTKTSRDYPDSIDHAVIFGHSLNEMDYDYFYYLFTILHFDTLDLEKMGSVEFVYSIYKPEEADKIRTEKADAIYKLLDFYERNTSKSKRKVLVNMLRLSKKLIITELSE